MDSLANINSSSFDKKVSHLLRHMYDSDSSDYKKFEFMPVRDYQIIDASDAGEFEAILDFAEKNGWLEWHSKMPFSGGRVRYQEVQLTRLGASGLREEIRITMLLDNAVLCPLTGISINGRAKFIPFEDSKRVSYAFEPIGRAIFEFDHLTSLLKSTANGNQEPRLDLAGRCREVSERREPALVITDRMFSEQLASIPVTHEDKKSHLLRLLYETGGREHKKRDLFIYNDFPMAFAKDAQEFLEILESLLDDGLLRYDKPNDIQNDWVDGIRTDYNGILLTPSGKQKATLLIANHSTSDNYKADLIKLTSHADLTNLHVAVQQAAGSLFASSHYPQAIHAACTVLEKAIQAKSGQSASLTGTALLGKAFPKDNPLISLSNDQGEREGYGFLYRGLLQAIRNHYAHNLTQIPAPRALEWLGFISALFYKLDEALPTSVSPASS